MYQVRFMPRAERYIKKLKERNLKEKIKNAIYEIQKDPYIGKMRKGDLSTIYGFDVFYHKTNYEISYQVYSKKQIIVIILIGTRENFYQELKNYLSNN